MGYRDDEHLIPKNVNSAYDSIQKAEEGRGSSNQRMIESDSHHWSSSILQMLSTVPAVLVMASYYIMLSVPFGTMFFSNDVPLPTSVKEKLGLRMSLIALGIGQTLMGSGMSGFHALTLWEMAEVAPFYPAFAEMAANNCDGDISKIYPTTAYLISLSTICFGIGFFLCGALKIGKLLSFFPSYVILGIIAGIGVWAAEQSITVSVSPHRFQDPSSSEGAMEIWNYLLTPHFALSAVLGLAIRPLRVLIPSERFLLLDPIYYLSIPILFHLTIRMLGVPFDEVVEAGYMFKGPASNSTMTDDESPSILAEAAELWTMFDISKVQWEVALQAFPQIFATAILGIMVTAPFIPPIATLLDTEDFSLDREFMAHGICSIVSGLSVPGGVPPVACYSSTVLYVNSGGGGKFANFLLAVTSFLSFVYGPVISGYLPRCMAGAILIDMGISLFLEGVADPSNKCDPLEYASIWVILTVMTVFDQTSGLIAALFMALFTSTYSSSNDDPVRRVCDAATFPSSRQRSKSELAILADPIQGRKKISIFQLQGSVFFGNISKIQDHVLAFLTKRAFTDSIVIFDCTLVSSLDSSACIFFDKIQKTLKRDHGVACTVFVASPPKLEIKKATAQRASTIFGGSSRPRRQRANSIIGHADDINPAMAFSEYDSIREKPKTRASAITVRGSLATHQSMESHQISGTCFDFLDKALCSCEDKLLSMSNIPLVDRISTLDESFIGMNEDDPDLALALQMMKQYCEVDDLDLIQIIVANMKREEFRKGSILWNLGDPGVSAKLFLKGSVLAYVLDEDDENRFRSSMTHGSFLGLRSLILDERHLATVRCESDCIFYTLDAAAYERLVGGSSKAARVLELSLARYLSHRLNHVSNRIYQARSVPV